MRRGCASKDFCENNGLDSVAAFEYSCDTCGTDLCNGCNYEEQPGVACRPRPGIIVKTVTRVEEEHRRTETRQQQKVFIWN